MIEIRDAVLEDVPCLLEIYDHYVKHTAITFEYETPSVEAFRERMRRTMQRYPYLVILQDGVIQGYAYAGPFVDRAAYDWGCELTIYLVPNVRKCGLGRRLYTALASALKAMGILNLYACIAYPEKDDEYLTHNSVQFHRHLGFAIVGDFKQCGCKFGRWYHMVWMEKDVGEHRENQPPVVPYPELKEKVKL